MGYRWVNRQCAQCQRWTIHRRRSRRLRHGLHLVLSLCTLGLWIPVWVGLAVEQWVRGPEPWRCSRCGAQTFEE